jgi:hypothetical protein
MTLKNSTIWIIIGVLAFTAIIFSFALDIVLKTGIITYGVFLSGIFTFYMIFILLIHKSEIENPIYEEKGRLPHILTLDIILSFLAISTNYLFMIIILFEVFAIPLFFFSDKNIKFTRKKERIRIKRLKRITYIEIHNRRVKYSSAEFLL